MASEAALKKIVEVFESGNIPDAIARSTFPRSHVPMNNWSRMNQILCMLQGTEDARGFRQWNEVGRKVKKGEKAIYILAPNMVTRTETVEDNETGETKKVKRQFLKGFRSIPVFAAESTDGEPLEYQKIELPPLPFMDVAEAWNIPVSAIPGNDAYYGLYRHSGEIKLATEDESVFFHELAHAAHHRVMGNAFKACTKEHKEIVAEFCAAALGYICNREIPKTIGNAYRYICGYSKAKDPINTCVRVINECGKVIDEIVQYAGAIEVPEAA